ncbi:MAG TPA: sulfatase-like hydrolase/transferase [Chitinophagales bacterium]|nr:sulfatase-like hydrolase/transferase [Chitinophagales bacterium]
MKLFSLALILLIPFSSELVFGTCTPSIPVNLKLKNITSCSVEASWKKVTGVSYYLLEYKVSGSSEWMFSNSITGNSVTISGLELNTSYDFAVASFCSNNTTVGYSPSISKTTKKCSPPINISSSSVTANSVLISWEPACGSNSYTLNYRAQGASAWTKVSNITASSCPLTNLQPNTTYENRIETNFGAAKSAWCATHVVTTLNHGVQKKNILMIVLDDARYDAFIPNGAPSWLNTPAINRIANEGVNFKLMIPTTSQCAPSRACIYTGVYPHINGLESNGDTLNSSFPLIQQILKDHGYYTGFIGKYGQFMGDPKGFNWWAVSSTETYVDPPYTINGKDTTISGHISDVYPQLAKTFLNTVPAGQNFVLYYFTRVPHGPTTPRPQDSLLYLNETIPFASNYTFYTSNYPSFYSDQIWNVDTPKVNALKLAMYQTLKSVDDNVDSLLKWIQQRDGTLDSTLIIFTSDNGYLMGEHHLHEKILALEESIRVPLFIRYPKWFGSNSVITDEIGSNVDIAATLLDFTALPNNYGFQGLSLHQLANGQAQRKNFFYESGWDPSLPKLRAVRSLTDIYIRSYCKTTTEEYYDLVTDSLNNTNLIFNSGYQSTIAARRILLDSLRTVYSDPEPRKKICNLITSGERFSIYNNDETPELEMAMGPNPAAETFTIYFTSHQKSPVLMSICDELGHVLWRQQYSISLDVMEEIDCSKWGNGLYLVKAEQDGRTYGRKILVQQ